MKPFLTIILILSNISLAAWAQSDSEQLAYMVKEREYAMQTKDLPTVLKQFAKNITWINSQGYYFAGYKSVADFHNMMTNDHSRDYQYKAGKPLIRILDANNALVYYSWQMLWHQAKQPAQVIKDELGLMTLHAAKISGKWKWIAVSNQHTPWFYDEITPVQIHKN